MRNILLIIFAALFFQTSFAQFTGLPNYMTEEEKRIGNNYVTPPPVNPFAPPGPVRTMAEWEEADGIIMTWTSYTPLLRQIVDAAQEEGMVWIFCSDSNSVRSYLQSGNVPLVNIQCIIASFNSVWSRDYGPWCVYNVSNDSMGLVDFKYNRPRPLDDVIPQILSTRWGLPIYQTISGQDSLAHTGGNYMVDGFGTSFRSRLTEIENSWHTTAHIDSILFRYCGIQIGRSISMTVLPYDGIHHIDMHMKLLDEETLLIGQYPTGVADGPQIELNVQYIQTNYQNCYGRPYRIVRIPMPPSSGGQYPPSSSYFTYTNSLIINKTVLVPIYNFPTDTTALRIYRENMSGYNVIGYDCNAIIPASGAIHCITKEIGTRNPVLIYHARLQDKTDTTVSPVLANIKNRNGIDSALVYYRTDTTQPYTRLVMTSSGGNNWATNIPAQTTTRTVYYYIKARTTTGKYYTKPSTAPQGYFKYNVTITPIGIEPISNNIPDRFSLEQNYPNPFNPNSKIKFQIARLSTAKLVVFDVLGREIKTLVNEQLQPGTYEVGFNGNKFASGIYFYKMQTEGFTDIKKMVLMK